MPLVQAKCTNCGATLQVENTMDAAICPYCGTAYIVEKAVNNFNTANNIHAQVVNIYGGNSADFVIRAGTLEKYNGAATEVVIPNSVTAIGPEAFRGCSGLTSVTIPNSVYRISYSAFQFCNSLTSVTIPNSVTKIEPYAFSGCSNLTSITIPNKVLTIHKETFSYCSNLTSVTIPNSVNEISESAFLFCSSLSSVTIPNSVTNIGRQAFYGCSNLTSVTFGSTQTQIEPEAFSGCDDHLMIHTSSGHSYLLRSLYTPPSENTPSSETTSSSEGCYIATAVYDSYDCPQVWILRRYRDNTLASTWYGRFFIHTYYAVSPTLVRWFGRTKWFQTFWRKRLDRLIARLKASGIMDTPYRDRTW